MGWQLIESQSLQSSAASVTFSNIPQTYKSLKVLVSTRGNNAATFDRGNIQFNVSSPNYSPTGYTERILQGTGSSVGSFSGTSFIDVIVNGANATANTFANTEYTISNYSSTTANKVVSVDTVTENNATEAYQAFYAGLWSSTSAITAVTIFPLSGNIYVFGSTFTLYGLL